MIESWGRDLGILIVSSPAFEVVSESYVNSYADRRDRQGGDFVFVTTMSDPAHSSSAAFDFEQITALLQQA